METTYRIDAALHGGRPDPVELSSKTQYWTDAISSVYFPIQAVLGDPVRFRGDFKIWDLGEVSLSRLETDSIRYDRLPSHLRTDKEEHILITFAGLSDLRFVQDRMSLTCRKEQFFIEQAHMPYEFVQADANIMWVLRMSAELLKRRVRSVEKYAPYTFDASRGIGLLLFDMLRMLPSRLREANQITHHGIAHSLIDLLALSLEGDDRVLGSQNSTVQKAHLARIERFIRKNLASRDLSPETIASACGISTRYLHELYQASGTSVSRWIREQRLIACDQDLRDPSRRDGIAEIAYRWGFGDHAMFSRHFKAYFGRTPRDSRDQGRHSLAVARTPDD